MVPLMINPTGTAAISNTIINKPVSTLRKVLSSDRSTPALVFFPPRDGDEWRVNLYRIDTDGENVEFQAWSPTGTAKPQFHVPERFGVLQFAEDGEERGPA